MSWADNVRTFTDEYLMRVARVVADGQEGGYNNHEEAACLRELVTRFTMMKRLVQPAEDRWHYSAPATAKFYGAGQQ